MCQHVGPSAKLLTRCVGALSPQSLKNEKCNFAKMIKLRAKECDEMQLLAEQRSEGSIIVSKPSSFSDHMHNRAG